MPKSRVKAACTRCRRQKLKCDDERPCALCMRSSFVCIDGDGPARRASRSVRTARAKSHSASATPQSRQGEAATSPQISSEHRAGSVSSTQYATCHSPPITSVGLSKEILHGNAEFQSPTDALPGGASAHASALAGSEYVLPISQIVGLELPPKALTDVLLESYFASVNWFMMVFHETTFREKYEKMATSGKARPDQRNQILLMILVLAIGARYVSEQEIQACGQQCDIELLQSTLLSKVAESFMTILDESDLAAVQLCVLLSSHYLYYGKPNLGFIVLGTGLRCAYAMDLHRESMWTGLDPTVREERKRVWWALYVFDRFASIIFGRPCGIQDSEVNVSMIQNMNDTAAIHTSFKSVELGSDGNMQHVTIFSYQRLKFELYQIAAPIIERIRHYQKSPPSAISDKIMEIHRRLITWFSSLPSELRLNQLQTTSLTGKSSVESIFSLQALALQLAYDNIQIVLHKPMLSSNKEASLNHVSGSNGFDTMYGSRDPSIPPTSQDPTTISKLQCWESAIRTSRLASHERLLRIAMSTHAASFVGMHLFTSGMVLSTVALSQPLSSQAQEAKYAISQIVRVLSLLKDQTLLSRQSVKVLEAVVRVLLDKERKRIMSGDYTRESSPFNHGTRSVLPPAPAVQTSHAVRTPHAETMYPAPVGTQSGLQAPVDSNPRPEELSGIAYEHPGGVDASMLFNADLEEGINDIQGVMTDVLAHDSSWAEDMANLTGYTDAWDSTGQSWLWGPVDRVI